MLQKTKNRSSSGKLFVPSLGVAFFSAYIIESLTNIFLPDIATTFFGSSNQISIAITAQLVTLSSAVSVFFGVLLGVLSVSYNHKRLLLLGNICVVLGIIGCFFAPNFLFMQIFFPIEGIGTAAIAAMAFTLVGELLVLNKRPKAIGWIISCTALGGISSSLVISLFFSGTEGWRSYLLWFALPISLVALTAVYFGVPSPPQKQKVVGKKTYLSSFKQVFLKKSAAASLIGFMVKQAAFAWSFIYAASFFREEFGLSIEWVALVVFASLVTIALASVVGGYLVNRVGRKLQFVATSVISTPPLMLIAFVPNLWIVLILHLTGVFSFYLGFPAGTSLLLEQAPESRGTMMSMNTIFSTLGLGIGSALGGAALVLSGWIGAILIFAILNLITAAIFFFLTEDPCITMETDSMKPKLS
jgi:predicted MFS family arabinose efflux permease